MWPAQSTSSLSGPRFSSEALISRSSLGAMGASGSSLTAPHALALTSKQRVLSVDLLQSVARILRKIGPLLEAAALREAMLDAEASEYMTAAMTHAEASVSSESAVLGSTSGVPSVSFLPYGGDSAPLPRQLSCSASIADPVRLVTVLQTSGLRGRLSIADSVDSVGDCPARRRQSAFCSLSSVDISPSRTRSPRSSFRASSHVNSVMGFSFKDQLEQAGQEEDQSFAFPPVWFTAAAVKRLARSKKMKASQPPSPPPPLTFTDKNDYLIDVPSRRTSLTDRTPEHNTSLTGLPTMAGADAAASVGDASTPLSASGSTDSFSSMPHNAASQSLPTAVFAHIDTPMAAHTALEHAGSAVNAAAAASKSAISESSSSASLLSQTPKMNAGGAFVDRPTVATAQPPLFVDNMLLDPSTGVFLFGGHAFREEARVLFVPSSMTPPPPRDSPEHRDDARGTTRRCTVGRSSITVAPPASPPRAESSALLLVREYFPITPLMTAGGGRRLLSSEGGVGDDVVVQSFSLLPPWLTQVPPNRYQLLSEEATIACVCQALPGCVTVVTALSRFLRGDRRVSQSSQYPSQLVSNVSAFGESFRPPAGAFLNFAATLQRDGADGIKWPNSNFTAAFKSGSGTAYRGSPLRSRSPSSATPVPVRDGPEIEAARIVAAAERLSAVPPDVIDEALAAVRFSLEFYSAHAQMRRRVRDVFAAVRVLQYFFRRCLTVKRRALRRMMRIWRKLEVEARLKLQQHRPLPSAVERIDAVANSILQEHMLTSLDYKRKFIKDEWNRRRAAFAKWKEEEHWNAVFAEEQRAKAEEAEKEEAAVTTDGTAISSAMVRRFSARLTAEEEQHMEDVFNRRRSLRRRMRQATACPISAPTNAAIAAATVAAADATAMTVQNTSSPPCSSTSLAEVTARRYQEAMRKFCSWYMDPHELLYLSHQRLLETLKGTVLRIEEVKSELSRAATEVEKGSPFDASASA